MDRRSRLIRSGLSLASELSLDVVLQRIVEAAAELTDARYGALGVMGADGRIAEFVTTGMSAEERARIGDPPTGHGILGLLIKDARPVRIANLAEHPLSYGFPKNHPPMTTFLGAPVIARGTVYGNIYLTDKHGGEAFDEQDEESLEVLAAQAGIAIENARLYEESQARQRWLAASAEVANAILSRSQPDEALQLVTSRARQLVQADLAWVVTPEASGPLRIAVADGAGAEAILGMTIPLEDSISGEVVRTGKAIKVHDPRHDDRSYRPLVEAADLGPRRVRPAHRARPGLRDARRGARAGRERLRRRRRGDCSSPSRTRRRSRSSTPGPSARWSGSWCSRTASGSPRSFTTASSRRCSRWGWDCRGPPSCRATRSSRCGSRGPWPSSIA